MPTTITISGRGLGDEIKRRLENAENSSVLISATYLTNRHIFWAIHLVVHVRVRRLCLMQVRPGYKL